MGLGVGALLWLVAAGALRRAAAGALSCEAPTWLTVFELNATAGCPGDWRRLAVPSQEGGGGLAHVCGRGLVEDTMMASAVLAEGYVCDAVRGKVVGYGMGSPDSFRPESGRGEATIDDAYVDGVALARWTPGGRVHVATYAAGLSYFQRDFWYEIGGNCVCHAGINLAPDWLGEDYYCDSPMRGPPATCAFGSPWEPDGCRSFDECERANCTGGWANGVWYDDGRASAFWGDEGYLCRGSRYAEQSDFGGRPFGTFLRNLSDFADDPIEARVMAGQPSGVAVFDAATNATVVANGNEEAAVRYLTLEVHGCRAADPAVCGDGVVTAPEECDDGGNATGACSLACTLWIPEPCRTSGTCEAEPEAEPLGEDFPGKEEIGSRVLPAWVPVANVTFDAHFRSLDAAPDAAAAGASGACSHIAPDDVLDACPGTLSKYLANGRYVCAPDPRASPAADAEPSSAFVAGPRNTFVAGFRGRIGAVALGSMDAFLSASWHPSDFSAFECAEASYGPQAPFDFAGALYPNDALDGAPGAGIDGRYVDGVSLTVGCEPRTHVFTLAGHADGVAASADDGGAVVFNASDPDLAAAVYETCFQRLPSSAACYAGNCACHSGAAIRAAALTGPGGNSSSPFFSVPDFVGDDFLCDGGSGAADGFFYANAWHEKRLFEDGATICGADGALANASTWGGRRPGSFVKALDKLTMEPLEIRVMAGVDTYFENLAIASVELEVCACADGMGARECFAKCEGTWVEDDCPPGRYDDGSTECAECPPGTASSGAGRPKACEACAPGSFAAAPGAAACDLCPAGTFAAGGAAACAVCGAGSFATVPGNRVGEGVVQGAERCEICPPGTESLDNGTTLCFPCTREEETSVVGVCDVCKEGYYRDAAYGSCFPCPDGAACPAGSTIETMAVEAGYYRFYARSPRVYACSHDDADDACAGTRRRNGTAPDPGDTWGAALCRRGAKGPLCKLCRRNRFRATPGSRSAELAEGKIGRSRERCVPCDQSRLMALEISRVVLVVFGWVGVALAVTFALKGYARKWASAVLLQAVYFAITTSRFIVAHKVVMPVPLPEYVQVLEWLTFDAEALRSVVWCHVHKVKYFDYLIFYTLVFPVVLAAGLLGAVARGAARARGAGLVYQAYRIYAVLWAFVYAVGLPAVFFVLLRRKRVGRGAQKRIGGVVDDGPLSFLTDTLKPEPYASSGIQLVTEALHRATLSIVILAVAIEGELLKRSKDGVAFGSLVFLVNASVFVTAYAAFRGERVRAIIAAIARGQPVDAAEFARFRVGHNHKLLDDAVVAKAKEALELAFRGVHHVPGVYARADAFERKVCAGPPTFGDFEAALDAALGPLARHLPPDAPAEAFARVALRTRSESQETLGPGGTLAAAFAALLAPLFAGADISPAKMAEGASLRRRPSGTLRRQMSERAVDGDDDDDAPAVPRFLDVALLAHDLNMRAQARVEGNARACLVECPALADLASLDFDGALQPALTHGALAAYAAALGRGPLRDRLDVAVCTEVLRELACAAFPAFRAALAALFAGEAYALRCDRATAVKDAARMRVKVAGYQADGGGRWPRAAKLGDALRATVVCDTPGALLAAYGALVDDATFSVRRLKNKLGGLVKPFCLHVNAVFESPGLAPVAVELQLVPKSIHDDQASHLLYDLARCATLAEFLGGGGDGDEGDDGDEDDDGAAKIEGRRVDVELVDDEIAGGAAEDDADEEVVSLFGCGGSSGV
ncbi:calcium ion binding protein [Aureococcus anophagefferens]|nr:calcium ion binding protein [Aureococcus anophagefferens]